MLVPKLYKHDLIRWLKKTLGTFIKTLLFFFFEGGGVHLYIDNCLVSYNPDSIKVFNYELAQISQNVYKTSLFKLSHK